MRSAISQRVSAVLLVSACVACSGGEFPGQGDGEIESIGVIEQALGPASDDLDVGFIQRLPSLDYVENSTNPKVQGWPAVGQTVTWRAHVHNFSTSARTVNYAWTYDGTSVKTGSVTLPAGSTTPLDYARAWAFERHQLRLAIDTGNSFAEIEENNNALSVFTDALSVGFYVEQSLYDYFNAHQRELVGVTLLLYGSRLGVGFLVVKRGVHVARTAGDDQGVDQVEYPIGFLRILRVGEQEHGTPAGPLDGPDVARWAHEGGNPTPGSVAYVLGGRRNADGRPVLFVHRRSKFL